MNGRNSLFCAAASLLIAVAVILLIFAVTSTPVSADTCTWTGTSGSWHVSGNWSCGVVPDNNDTAVINSGTVNADSDVLVQGLTLTGGTLQGIALLTVTSTMDWTGGAMAGTGSTIIDSGASLSISGSTNKSLNRVLDNYGDATWSGTGDITASAGDQFNNKSGATFEVQNNEPIGNFGHDSEFNNQGTFIKTAGTNETSIQSIFNNDGEVQVLTGTLRLRHGGTSGGSFTAQDSTLRFDSSFGTQNLGGTSAITATNVLFSNGTTNVNGDYSAANTTISAGTTSFNGNGYELPNFELSAGTLQGSATITITNSMNWTGGTIAGAGSIIVDSGADLSIGGSASKNLYRVLDNYGDVVWTGTGDITASSGDQFNNKSGATFEVQNNEPIGSFSQDSEFNNQGTFIKTGGAGETSMQSIFNNDGVVQVLTGTLRLRHGGTSGGSFTAQDSTLRFDSSFGTQNLGDTSIISATNVLFSNGTTNITGDYLAANTTISGGTASFNNANFPEFAALTHTGGNLNLGNSESSLTGDFSRSGGGFSAGTSTITFSSGSIQNLTLNAATTFNNLTVAAGSTVSETVAADNATIVGTLSNQGEIQKAKVVGVPDSYTFGLTGAQLNVTTVGTLDRVQVNWVGEDHPAADDETATGSYWAISPSGGGYVVDLSLPHQIDPHSLALLCRYDAGDWDCDRSSSTATTVTRNGISELSDWAIGTTANSLVVNLGGNGRGSVTSQPAGINCPDDCQQSYDSNAGTVVTLTAVADVGSVFDGWSGACSGTGNCVVTMDASREVLATFILEQYLLTVVPTGNGRGTVTSNPAGISCGNTCTRLFDYGTEVRLTAATDTGYVFRGWSGACSGTGECVVTMDETLTVMADFAYEFQLFIPFVTQNP